MGFIQCAGSDEACVECVVHFARVMFPHVRDFFFLTFQIPCFFFIHGTHFIFLRGHLSANCVGFFNVEKYFFMCCNKLF